MRIEYPKPLLDAAERVLSALSAKSGTLATAESCTGGLLATLLTEFAGSSAVYLGGVSSYANRAKTAFLGVPAAMIEAHGAVSSEVAQAMADGARRAFGATYAIALTGIAGPSGATPGKPVGTVWCGLAGPDRSFSTLLDLSALAREANARHAIRAAAGLKALTLLIQELAG